jgi:hypothetical protein
MSRKLLPFVALLLLLPALAVAQEEPPVFDYCLGVVQRGDGLLDFYRIPCPGAEATPTPTATSTPTATATPSATPTWTPFPTPFPTPTPEPLEYTPVPQPCYLITGSGNTNVRSEPYGAVVTQLPPETLFSALGYVRDGDGGMWVRRLVGGYVARWVVFYRQGCDNSIIEAGP